jgi:glycolate oxidase iron-sulfur subunit
MHCGMCLPTCPTYDATHHERNSPRGRIALMRAIRDGEMAVTAEFASEMSYCLGCLACQSACPAGVDYATLFEAARHDIERAGTSHSPARQFWRKLTLGFLFMRAGRLRAAGRALRIYQRSGLHAVVHGLGLVRLLPGDLRRLERQAPRVAREFSRALIAEHEEPTGEAGYRVAVLTGCVQDVIFPDVNRDTVDVLLANGCRVDTPREQPCCGSLHAHNGDLTSAAVLARRMLDLIDPGRYDAIISNAGGCGSHLRRYSHLLGDDPAYAHRARAWDARLRDISEWLVEIGFRPPQAFPFEERVSVTYHESCHLVHGQKVSRQPRDVLASLPGVSVEELPEAAWCCGAAGIYAITQPAQADALLARKLRHIEATGAGIVATANPGCHLQLSRGLTQSGESATVLHPVTLLARAYRAESADARSKSRAPAEPPPRGRTGQSAAPTSSSRQ